MPLATNQIRIAGNGKVYVAPAASALPTDESTALIAAYVDLGAVSEDGATITRNLDSDTVPIWQSQFPGRYLITGITMEIGLTLMQFNLTTLPLYFGGGTITATGVAPNQKFTYNVTGSTTIDERVMVIEANDGTTIYRYVFPRVMLTDTGDLNVKRTAASSLEMTFGVMAPATGSTLATVFSNDQNLAIA